MTEKEKQLNKRVRQLRTVLEYLRDKSFDAHLRTRKHPRLRELSKCSLSLLSENLASSYVFSHGILTALLSQ